MTPLEEKINHEIRKMKLISSWIMTKEAEDDIRYACKSVVTQAVEEERQRWLSGQACHSCGKDMIDMTGLSTMCVDCLENE